MHRRRDNFALTFLAVYVMAARHSLQTPASGFQQAAQLGACDRLHTAISRIWTLDSGGAPCSRMTASTPLIASRKLSINSDIESACE